MNEEKFVSDQTGFEDAAVETAGEPGYITILQKREITREPHISLRPDSETKRAKSYPHHLFQMLKTIEEVPVSSGRTVSPAMEPHPPVTSYLPLMRGKDHHLYQTLTITESLIQPPERETGPHFLSGDFFEDEPPAALATQVIDPAKKDTVSPGIAELNTPVSGSSEIPVAETAGARASPWHATTSQKPLPPKKQKFIDIPAHIGLAIGRSLNRTEHHIYYNFMKMQKR